MDVQRSIINHCGRIETLNDPQCCTQGGGSSGRWFKTKALGNVHCTQILYISFPFTLAQWFLHLNAFLSSQLFGWFKVCQSSDKNLSKALDERQDCVSYSSGLFPFKLTSKTWSMRRLSTLAPTAVVCCCSEFQPASLIIISALSWPVNGSTALHRWLWYSCICNWNLSPAQKSPITLVKPYWQQQRVTPGGLQELFTSYCPVIIFLLTLLKQQLQIIINS